MNKSNTLAGGNQFEPAQADNMLTKDRYSSYSSGLTSLASKDGGMPEQDSQPNEMTNMITLKNGDPVDVRLAVHAYDMIAIQRQKNPESFSILLAAYEGHNVQDSKEKREWQEANIIQEDGTLRPIYRSILESLMKAGIRDQEELPLPCKENEVEVWRNEIHRGGRNLLKSSFVEELLEIKKTNPPRTR